MLNQIAAIHGTGVAASTTSYESIATVTVGAGGSSSISFSSIPSTYKHLQVRYLSRSAAAANTASLIVRFNSDSGSNYYNYHEIYADGSTAAAYAGGAGTSYQIDQIPAANKTSGIFGVGIIDVLDYLDTNKNKTVRTLDGWDANGTGAVTFSSGLWKPTTPVTITSITITENNSNNLAQYSSFALYGVKG